MKLELNGNQLYVATGGKAFDASLPTVIFLHGSGLDHRCWAQQSRWFAFHGFSVLAPDFPGHSLSSGKPLESIEAMADWLWQLCDAVGVQKAMLVGHSQGGLVAMQAASDQPQRCTAISLIATAPAIGVNPALLELAQTAQPKAVDAMIEWGFGDAYRFGQSSVPGQAPLGIGARIMRANPLAVDLAACQRYDGGEAAAAKVDAPAQLILAKHDKMTPYKLGATLQTILPNCQSLETVDAGHMLPIEAPEQTLALLKHFALQQL
ncbi:MAG: alpha/beta hydrolase [Gammaproteobacteria bacterium]|nr:alpha/beta hydrolase [Gammaproteobacteria bacterium]